MTKKKPTTRLERITAQADLAERKLAIKRAGLVTRETAEREICEVLNIISQAMTAFPDQAAAKLEGKSAAETEKILTAEAGKLTAKIERALQRRMSKLTANAAAAAAKGRIF